MQATLMLEGPAGSARGGGSVYPGSPSGPDEYAFDSLSVAPIAFHMLLAATVRVADQYVHR